MMSESAKAIKRERHREWQRANRDKVAQYQERYWERLAREREEAARGQEGRPE